MPSFAYKSVTQDNRTVEGRMEAVDTTAVVARLHDLGQMPLSVTELSGGSVANRLNLKLFEPRGFSQTELIHLFSNLKLLLASGMDMDHALGHVAKVARRASFKESMANVQMSVRKGVMLSDALHAADPRVQPFVISTLRAGEMSGQLQAVLESLEKHLTRFAKFRAEILGALVYPAILLVMSVFAIVLLFTVVIPEFKPMFESAGASLPAITRFVLFLSDFFASYALVGVVLLLAASIGFMVALRQKNHRLTWDRFKLSLPLKLGGLIAKIQVAMFARLLALLLQNGVPMASAVSLTRDAIPNHAFAATLDDALREIREGGRLSGATSLAKVLPDIYLDLLKIGEEASHLEGMLTRIAELAETDIERTLKRIMDFLVPFLTIFLGVLIAGVISSVLLALLSVNQLAF